MIKDGQVKELRRMLDMGRSLVTSARIANMSRTTARSYRDDDRLQSQRDKPRNYRTRMDPFEQVWPQVQQRLQTEPKLQAVTLFGWLQDTFPGEYPDSVRRTFERRVLEWRSLNGPGKPVIFPQDHHPGRLAASDFTVLNKLAVTIAGVRFEHTLFHCVLTYSNVESVSLCFSESFEALSSGIQKAFWEFGGVPQRHRTDSLSAAINNHSSRKQLTDRYAALMDYYHCRSEHTNARCANENGDVESSNGHLKNTIDQALLLRGSRDFSSREQYLCFVENLIAKRNRGRAVRFAEEQSRLATLPETRLDTDDIQRDIRVSKSSTIQVRKNTYSVPSRLIGQIVDAKIGAEWIDITHHGSPVQRMERILGVKGTNIHYRHIIDSLLRKPGAFANYRYREDLFPTAHFRMAYDQLSEAHRQQKADKNYIQLLALAARESETAVQDALRLTIQRGDAIDVEKIRRLVEQAAEIPAVTDVQVDTPQLFEYDDLLNYPDMEIPCDDEKHDPQEETGGEDAIEVFVESEPDRTADRPIPRASSAEFSGSVRTFCDTSGEGEPQSLGIPLGANCCQPRSDRIYRSFSAELLS